MGASALAVLAGCGNSAPAKVPGAAESAKSTAVPPSAAPAPTVAPDPASAKPSAQDSSGFVEALAALRPEGTLPSLQAISDAPGNADAYAQATSAFAGSHAPGMALLYGMTYQAMGGGTADNAVATALQHVLRERILAAQDPETRKVTYNLRLAPGRMPLRQEADGAVLAPVAHAFEALFGPAVTSFQPPWTIEQFHDSLSTWAGRVAAQGTPLDEKLELNAWLVNTAKSGHLEAYCQQLLGPAFATEHEAYQAAHLAELKAYVAYRQGAPLLPKHALMPDELVRLK